MEIYRVTADSPEWMKKAYDYVRTDAFCFGQNIPVELEFSVDVPGKEADTILLVEDHKPLAGCRITYPAEKTAKIGRVCVIREKQKSGVGRTMIEEAEHWIAENGAEHIVISSQDRAAGFYQKVGYVLNPDVDPDIYEEHKKKEPPKEKQEKRGDLGFRCVLVEKYLK